MPLDQDIKAGIIAEFKRGDADTGSPEVVIAILTARISNITKHLQANSHDYSSTRGLKKMVGQRRRLLKYLKKKDYARYVGLCTKLGIKTIR